MNLLGCSCEGDTVFPRVRNGGYSRLSWRDDTKAGRYIELSGLTVCFYCFSSAECVNHKTEWLQRPAGAGYTIVNLTVQYWKRLCVPGCLIYKIQRAGSRQTFSAGVITPASRPSAGRCRPMCCQETNSRSRYIIHPTCLLYPRWNY